MKKQEIPYSIFAQLDVVVGKIKRAVGVEGSQKLLELSVDLGDEYGEVIILSGVAQWYTPDELVGKKTLVLANLAPRSMMGKVSEAMLLAINGPQDEAKLIILEPGLAEGLKLC